MSQVIRKSLMSALQRQDFEGFRSIIRSLGLPRDATFTDYALLAKAIKLGCKRIANLLLDQGARVFRKQGLIAPLHLAVAKAGWQQVVERLLENGARVADKNSRGDTALHVAFAHRAPGQLVDLLLRKHLEDSSENLTNKDKLSFLHIACSRPHVDVVARLMGMDKQAVTLHQVSAYSDAAYAGFTPMHFAVAHGNYQVAKFLLEYNPSFVYAADSKKSSPLHLAVEQRDVKMIDLILQHDRDGYVCSNTDGLSHFMAACVGSDSSIVARHLRSADERSAWSLSSSDLVNSRVQSPGNIGGYAPLHFAAEFGRAEAIEALLDKGADCCATTHRGISVHELAKDEVKDLLQSHCEVFKKCERMHVRDYDFGDINGNYEVQAEVKSDKALGGGCKVRARV